MSDVKRFGAVGDGTADDTDAIQHAVRDGDGVLLFPPGAYRITRPIVVRLDERGPLGIDGSLGTARVLMAGAGPAFRLVGTHGGTASPATVKAGVWQRERQPTVRGIEIVGVHDEADGVELIGTMQAILAEVSVRRARHGIRLLRRNRNVLITHCHLYHNRGVGVFLDRVNLHQINIASSHLSYNRLGGIRVEGSEVRNLQITGNDIEYNNHDQHGTDPEPTAEIWVDTSTSAASVHEIAVASNTIQATPSPGGANIRIRDDANGGRAPGLWTIAGNVIGNQENSVHLSGCHGVVLSGNTIYSSEKHNLLIERCSQINVAGNAMRRHTPTLHTGIRLVDSRDCVISGTTVCDESEAGQASGASLLELIRCRRVTVAACQLLDGVPFGLDVESSSQINVSGCTILESRAKPRASGAVRFHGAGAENFVAGNTFGSLAIADESGVRLGENRTVR